MKTQKIILTVLLLILSSLCWGVVTYPISGTFLTSGQQCNITWTDPGWWFASGWWSSNNGGAWNPIFSNIANQHSYGWTVPIPTNLTNTLNVYPTSLSFTSAAGSNSVSVTAFAQSTSCQVKIADGANNSNYFVSGTFIIQSNLSWSVSSGATWVTVSPSSGTNGGSFTVYCSANTSTSSRNTNITVTGGGITRTIPVTQSGATPTLNISPTTFSAPYTSGSFLITVSSSTSWSVSSNVGWITCSPTSGSNNGSFTLSFSQNTSTSSRTGAVTVSGTGVSSQTCTVTQAPGPSLTISPTTYYAPYTSGSFSISVLSNTSWSVSSNVGWITCSPTSGSNNGSFTVSFLQNTSTSSRTGMIVVSGTGVSSQSCTVYQSPGQYLTISPATYSAPCTSGSFSISVSSNISWSVSGNVGWITCSPTSGNNNGSSTVTYSQNSSTSTRTGTITISGTGVSSLSCTVTQAGMPIPTPTLISPSQNALGISTGISNYPIAFSWSSVTGAVNYDIQIANNSSFSSPIPYNLTSTIYNATTLSLTSHTQYYWHVRANTSGGTSSWSETGSFWTWDQYEPNNTLTTYSSLTTTYNQAYSNTINANIAYNCNGQVVDWDFYAFDAPYNFTQVSLILDNLDQDHNLYMYQMGDPLGNPHYSSTYTGTHPETINADVQRGGGMVNGKYMICVQNASGTTNPTNSFYTLQINLTQGTSLEDVSQPSQQNAIYSNYPNPFNPTTCIKFSLESSQHVNITIFDISGKKVKTVLSENRPSGMQSIIWDGDSEQGLFVSSGVYIVKMKTGSQSFIRRIALTK